MMLQALENATSWDVCGLAKMVLGPSGKAFQQVEQGVFQLRLWYGVFGVVAKCR